MKEKYVKHLAKYAPKCESCGKVCYHATGLCADCRAARGLKSQQLRRSSNQDMLMKRGRPKK